MAKGGSIKGHMQQSHNNGSRGRSTTTYAVLVLLAFGVVIFGVMILHKLREKQMFNLLVKDKETQLIHLQLLLQKEREHTKEAKRKHEEMKSKMQWVRTQKRDLESRIMEMKSTISSLKDEQRIIEATLEEKQDEINTLREKLTKTNRDDAQVKLLSESLQQKEAEIDIPVKIWSVSADDPSNPAINFTKAAVRKEANRGETEELRETLERDDQKNSTENIHSTLKRDEATTRQGEDKEQAEDGEESVDWKSNTGEQESHELRAAQEDVPGDMRSTILQTLDGKRETTDSSKAGEIFLEEKRFDSGNASMATINRSGQVEKQSNEVGVVDAADWREHRIAIRSDQGNFEDSQGNNQEPGHNHKSSVASRMKQEHIGKTKGKSRRIIAESKDTENGGHTEKLSVVSMRNKKFFTGLQESETNEGDGGSKQEKQEHKQEKSADQDSRNEYGPEYHKIDVTYKTQSFKDLEENFGNQIRFEPEQKPDMRRPKKQHNSSNLDDALLRKTIPNHEKYAGTEEGIREGRKSDKTEITLKGKEIEASNTQSEMSWSSQEVPTKTAVSKVNRVSKEARNRRSDGTAQSQQAVGISRKHQDQKLAGYLPNSLEHANIAERDVKADEVQINNDQETGEIDQPRGISQEARYQKLSTKARAEEENDTIFRDTEQRLPGDLHSSSTHVENAQMALKDSNLDAENDEETEDEDHSKGSAANLEEGEELN